MSKLPNKHRASAVELGHVITLHFFRDMSNPVYQGSKFTWQWFFEEGSLKHLNSSLSLYFSQRIWRKYKHQIIDYADKAAKITLQTLQIAIKQKEKS